MFVNEYVIVYCNKLIGGSFGIFFEMILLNISRRSPPYQSCVAVRCTAVKYFHHAESLQGGWFHGFSVTVIKTSEIMTVYSF